MSDDNEELKGLIEALAEVGNITATVIPIGLRAALRKAKQMLPLEPNGHQHCAAHRLVALTLVVNGFLILKKTSEPGAAEELINENIKFAKFLLEQGVEQADENKPTADWLTDEQLKQMFKGVEE